MRLLPTFVLLTLVIMSQAQTGAQAPSDLTIVKFKWEKQQVQLDNGDFLHTVRAVESQMPPPGKNEPERIRNSRDMRERADELRAGEQDAARSAIKSSDIYVYLIKVKNTGSKVVKSFVWEYQPSPNERDTARQFLCEVKTKPNDSKEFQVWSPSAPSKIVDVGAEGNNSPDRGRLIINKIVYDDSSVWQRTGWDPSILAKTGNEKVSNGRCIVL